MSLKKKEIPMDCNGESVAHRTVFVNDIPEGNVYHDLDTNEIKSDEGKPIDLQNFIGKTVSIKYGWVPETDGTVCAKDGKYFIKEKK